MTTIKSTGTATQICEWMGVPDPAIHHVMLKLREVGLTQVIDGHLEHSAPLYNTAEAFDLYARRLGQKLPPEAARLLEAARAKQDEERAKGIAPVTTPSPLIDAAALAPATKRVVRTRGSNTREQALAIQYARANGLVTKEDIGSHYGKLDANGFLKESFRATLARFGLRPHPKKSGRVSVYDPNEVDKAARKAGIEVPVGPWKCLSEKPSAPVTPAKKPKPQFLSLAEFLHDKEIDGEAIDPSDYREIEMELNTQYQLRPRDGLDGVKLYSKADLNSSWRRYKLDTA